jgi:hypothetical protein
MQAKKVVGPRERKRGPTVVLGRMEMNLVSANRSACFSGRAKTLQ